MELQDTRSIHPWVADARDGVRVGVLTIGASDVNVLIKQAQLYHSLGYDSFWLVDHPLRTADPWIELAAIARETGSIRLGVMVTCAAYRHPVMLARAVADVDRISQGRVVLGIGSGDVPSEFAAMGLEYGSASSRRQRLEDSLKSIPDLLRGNPVSLEGADFKIREALLPLPAVQAPRIPILVAGGSRQTLLLVAEYGDACNLGAVSWAGGAYTTAELEQRLTVLRESCAEIGRDYDAILRTGLAVPVLADNRELAQARIESLSPAAREFGGQLFIAGTPADVIEGLNAMIDVGIVYLVVLFVQPDGPQRFAADVMPHLHRIRRPANSGSG